MSDNYWQQSFELKRKDGHAEKTVEIAMNAGFQAVLDAAVRRYCPTFKQAGHLLLIGVVQQNHEMLNAIRDSMPGAFEKSAEVPVRQLLGAIAAREDFPSVIDWLYNQGLDATESYPQAGAWEEIQPWRQALINGHLNTIGVFTGRAPELLSTTLPLVDDQISPIALMCANGKVRAALALAERTPELIDIVCDFAGEAMDTPAYLDRLGHPADAASLRSCRAAVSARAAIDAISTLQVSP